MKFSNTSVSLLDIIEINLIRKKILQNISLFSDISNFSKTCKLINYIIQNDFIDRNIVLHDDYQFIDVKIKEEYNINQSFFSLPLHDNIEIISTKKNYEDLENKQKFFGEIINSKIYIKFRFYDQFKKLKGNDYKLFINRLVEKIDLNCESRKNANFLSLWNDMDQNIDLQLCSYLKHANIRRIEVTNSFLEGDLESYKKIGSNIFNGFPKLCEFLINFSIPIYNLNIHNETNDTVEYIMKDLSEISNVTLILNHRNTDNVLLNKYFLMIFTIATKYNIHIKYITGQSQTPAKKTISMFRTFNFFILKNNLTTFSCCLENQNEFPKIIILSQHFLNLQNLQLTFHYFDIKNYIKKQIKYDYKCLSYKHCKKLKNVALVFDYLQLPGFHHINQEKIVQRNLKYLSSLMPDTVEILKLENFTNLTRNIIEKLNIFMPNIKLLEAMYVSYQDINSLTTFKHLQYLRCINKGQFKVPEQVKLFSIRQYEDMENENSKNENKTFLKMYRKQFSKCIKNKNEVYIFFNDILHWDMYKSLIQKYNWS